MGGFEGSDAKFDVKWANPSPHESAINRKLVDAAATNMLLKTKSEKAEEVVLNMKDSALEIEGFVAEYIVKTKAAMNEQNGQMADDDFGFDDDSDDGTGKVGKLEPELANIEEGSSSDGCDHARSFRGSIRRSNASVLSAPAVDKAKRAMRSSLVSAQTVPL